jgi:phosphatidylserine decarboxylase
MTALIRALTRQEQLNFLLTNRIPRITLTRFIGWYSVIESRALTRFSIAIWRLFGGDLNLDESRQREFRSLRDCFIRELKPGMRHIDPDPAIITSPCDAIVGACGPAEGTRVYHAKGFPYQLEDLIPDASLVEKIRDGVFVTLRLKSNMYHRFHAPRDCRVSQVVYQSGDTWNVNPVALKRIEGLFCKNERAVIELETGQAGLHLVMVPVAAILVASMKFHCLEHELDLRYRGPNRLRCDASYNKGDEMGYFQQGSTILLFASRGYRLHDRVLSGQPIRMGEPLLVENPGPAASQAA